MQRWTSGFENATGIIITIATAIIKHRIIHSKRLRDFTESRKTGLVGRCTTVQKKYASFLEKCLWCLHCALLTAGLRLTAIETVEKSQSIHSQSVMFGSTCYRLFNCTVTAMAIRLKTDYKKVEEQHLSTS